MRAFSDDDILSMIGLIAPGVCVYELGTTALYIVVRTEYKEGQAMSIGVCFVMGFLPYTHRFPCELISHICCLLIDTLIS